MCSWQHAGLDLIYSLPVIVSFIIVRWLFQYLPKVCWVHCPMAIHTDEPHSLESKTQECTSNENKADESL